jgi:hypothetical protein
LGILISVNKQECKYSPKYALLYINLRNYKIFSINIAK